MPKRERVADRKPLQQCLKRTRRVLGGDHDPFSRLSDDIIVSHILSRLPLKEAVKTSVLSHRWHKLWTGSIGSKLIFSYSFNRNRHPIFGQVLSSGISRILEIVKPTLDELVVGFDFNSSSYHRTFDSWVEIALRKGVTRLELDFSPFPPYANKDKYTFPGIDKLPVWHAAGASVNNLRDVCLKYINVSQEVIELMLSNCPFLERLCVWSSNLVDELIVSTQSSKLKSLEFVHCYYKKIVISSPNLVSWHYKGFTNGFRLEHVPLLSEVHIGSWYCRQFLKYGASDFRHLSQLKKLTLDIYDRAISESIKYPLDFPELVKLEQLEINLLPYESSSLLWLLILIKAAPFLQKFSIRVNRQSPSDPVNYTSDSENPEQDGFRKNILCSVEQVHHQSLKLIEMRGFKGYFSHMELGQHLLVMAQSLEQLVVWPYYLKGRDEPNYWDDRKIIKKYRKRAQQLDRWLPPTAKLVLL